MTPCIVALASVLAGEPGFAWAEPPALLAASPARNPALAGTHVVYRVRAGGIGHLVLADEAELVIPGSIETAAVTRAWNRPAVAVDAKHRAHVVWGPPSPEPLHGTFYARIEANGTAGPTRAITSRWVEDVDIAVRDDVVHVLVNAIGDAPAVVHLRGPVDDGPSEEVVVADAATFREPTLRASASGLVAVGRFTSIQIASSDGTAWTMPTAVAIPELPITSVGHPQRDDGTALWGAVAWTDATPVSVVARRDGAPWAQVSLDAPFDPEEADGGSPELALAVTADGDVHLAWLGADAPRLRVWSDDGAPIAIADTDDATSFDVVADGDALRAVWADDDGRLWSGRLVRDASPDGGTAGTSAGSGTDTGETPDGSDEASYPLTEGPHVVFEEPAGCGCGNPPPRRTLPPLALLLCLRRRWIRARRE
jgi:hypothetical protein